MKKAKRSVSKGKRKASSSQQKRAVSDNTRTASNKNMTKPFITLMPDSSTDALKTLSKMRFLNEEPSLLDQRVQASKSQEKSEKLAAQYLNKQQSMKDNIKQQLSTGGRIVNMEIPVKLSFKAASKKDEDWPKKKLADGFVRSERSAAMRVRDTIDQEIEDLRTGKDDLIINLNSKMLKLDELTSEKKMMHEKLAEQIQFVRDLQRALGGASIGDLNTLVAQEVREAYNQEKALHRRLEEQLVTVDAERTNILEKIKLLSGEKREVIVIQNGQKKTFQVTSKNIDSLSQQIKAFVGQIRQQENAIQNTRDTQVKLISDIQTVERQLVHLNSERNMLLQKTNEIQSKNDHAVACLGGETARASQIHRAHSKLLSIRLLESLLSKQVQATQQQAFQQLWKVNNDERAVFLIQTHLQKIFTATYLRQTRTAIQMWFQKGFAPMKTKQQDKALPHLLLRVDRKALQLSKWTVEQQITGSEQQKGDGNLRKLLSVARRLEYRLKTWSFQVWQKQSHLKTCLPSTIIQHNLRFALQRVRRSLQNYRRFTVAQQFHKWRSETVEQLSQFRLQALAKSFAVQQMISKILTGWKVVTSQKKLKKRSLLLSTFKNLKTNMRRHTLLANSKVLVQSMKTAAGLSIIEACFDRLKYYTQARQLKKNSSLKETITPTICELKQEIESRKQNMEKKATVRAIHALVITPFTRQLNQVFQKWSLNAANKEKQFSSDLKILVQKSYTGKLRLAFDRMKITVADKQRKDHHSNIDQIHAQNYQMQSEWQQINQQIIIRADNVRQQGLKQFKELCCKASQQQGRQWMQRWFYNAKFKTNKLNAAQIILNKIRKRILRTALANYKRGFGMYVQDQYNFRRAHEVKRRLAFRIKKRIFQSILDYSNHHNAKVITLSYLMKTTNRRGLVGGMLAWQQFSQQNVEAGLIKSQKQQVRCVEQLQDELSVLADISNERDLVNKRFESALRTGASETLKKWVSRSHLGGQQYGFITWKQKTHKLKHRARLLKFLSLSIDFNVSATVWFRWKQTTMLDDRKNIRSNIGQKAIAIQCHEQKISFNRQQSHSQQNILEGNKQNVDQKREAYTQRATRIVEKLIKQRKENIFLSRPRYMFQQWRIYSQNQRKCVESLEKGISKMCLQRAFLQIRNFHLEDYRNEVLSAHLNNIFRLKLLVPARQALTKWRSHMHTQVHQEIAITEKKNAEAVEMQTRKIEEIRQVQIQRRDTRFRETLKTSSFQLWKQFYLLSRLKNNQTKKTWDVSKTFEIRKAIYRLNARAKLTRKFKAILALFEQKRNRIYLQACFVKSMKFMFRVDKNIANGVRHLQNSLVFSKSLLAFKRIKHYAEIKFEASCRKKEQAIRQLDKVLERLRAERLRDGQRLIRLASLQTLTMYTKLKQCFNMRSVINQRSYFEQWRQNSLKQSVADHNNLEDGPVNVECWHDRIECRNLIQMMRDDGNPDQEVQAFMERQTQKFFQLGEKTVCRLMIHKDINMRLLPITLDRMRNYSKVKKLWREKLRFLNGLIDYDKHNIFLRFQRWRNFDAKMRECLGRKPVQDLRIRSDADTNRLLHISDEVEYHDKAIEEFKEQKGVLFRCFIGGQKLALANTKAMYERAQQKAFVRFSDFGNNALQCQIGSTIDRNLALIQDLKDRINHLESQNHQVSIQNDQFRFDAVQAVHNAHQVQILEQDNERIQCDVANSAQIVKNLLSDNQLLSRQLQDHRVEAKIQLEHTQNLQNQKLAELEKLRMAERLTSSSRRTGSIRTQYMQSQLRENNRSMSPVIQDHSISVGNKSPLRLRPSIQHQRV